MQKLNLEELLSSALPSRIYTATLSDEGRILKQWYVIMYDSTLHKIHRYNTLNYFNINWMVGEPVQLDLNHIFAEYTPYPYND